LSGSSFVSIDNAARRSGNAAAPERIFLRGTPERPETISPRSDKPRVYNPRAMIRCSLLASVLAALAIFAAGSGRLALAQQYEQEINARARVFPDVGRGVRAIKRDGSGRYYVLTSPGAAIGIYRADGARVGQVPAAPSKDSAIVFSEDFDVDAAGRVVVADRGANAVKIFAPSGTPALTIPVASPTSVAVLPDNEVAVTSLKSAHLVTVYDARGKLVRDFGDLSDLAERVDLNQFLNVGRIESDPAGHIYYAFSYFPEPTVRKYDRYGYAAFEISLKSLEYEPTALAMRREIFRQEQRSSPPNFKVVVNALGADPATQQIWVALGDQLLHFDRDGNRIEAFRTYTPEGGRLEADAILVEPDRLLLASDPLGIYDFPRPDKKPTTPSHE
jgi:hypothetical protein